MRNIESEELQLYKKTGQWLSEHSIAHAVLWKWRDNLEVSVSDSLDLSHRKQEESVIQNSQTTDIYIRHLLYIFHSESCSTLHVYAEQ